MRLASYRLCLKSERHNAAKRSPGRDVRHSNLGSYPLAEHYLQAAVSRQPSDTQSAERLKTAELVLRMDPFRRQISVADAQQNRSRGFRSCGSSGSVRAPLRRLLPQPSGTQPSLADNWAKLKPRISEAGTATKSRLGGRGHGPCIRDRASNQCDLRDSDRNGSRLAADREIARGELNGI